MIRLLITFISALFLCTIGYARVGKNLSGDYRCQGSDITNHRPFTCNMYLIKTNDTYSNQADCDDGTHYQGTGIYNSSKHTLAIVALNTTNPTDVNLALINVGKYNNLTYQWTHLNSTTTGTIKCTKNSLEGKI